MIYCFTAADLFLDSSIFSTGVPSLVRMPDDQDANGRILLQRHAQLVDHRVAGCLDHVTVDVEKDIIGDRLAFLQQLLDQQTARIRLRRGDADIPTNISSCGAGTI